MPHHKQGAYDGFDSIAEAKKHYRRARSLKHFILSDEGVKTSAHKCAFCQNPIDVQQGNRCQYHPQTGKVAIMHYECAWKNIFGHIFAKEQLI